MTDPIETPQSPPERARIAELERERDELKAQLARAQSIAFGPHDAIVAMMAHELRTPLQSIMLTVKMVGSRLRSSAEPVPRPWLLDKLELAERSTSRVRSIIETFLGAKQIEAGTLQLHLEEMDLRELLQEVLFRLRDELTWAGCSMQLDAPVAIRGSFDRFLLDLIFSNLLSNAMKFSSQKPVFVELNLHQSEVVFRVRDGGPGIPPDQHERIFEKFQRLPGPNRILGVGLGLWIVRHACAALGGSVQVESEPGHGATFAVRLPCRAQALPRGAPASTSASVVELKKSVSPTPILIVDDDEDIRGAMGEILEERGYEVSYANDGRGALRALDGGMRPGLILLDMQMPEMSGRQFLSEISHREYGPTIKVVLLTGARLAELDTAVEVLQKPVTPETLVVTVVRLCPPARGPDT